MKKSYPFGMLVFVAILSGCSATWEPIGSPSLQLQEAKNLCGDVALSQYPVKNEVATRSAEKQITVKCNKDEADCGSSGYKYVNKLGVESYAMDVNERSRSKSFLSCMAKNGWKDTSWL
ncbi:hypothetical protein [Serratia marcescens]|uniref:hypothetical protein n=1 Tax=Serratia marcescens TaxID=615 RepID=UPI003F82F703